MRRVWFSNGLSVPDDVVSADEMGDAPFVLLVEFVPPVGGIYTLKAQVRLRDATIAALIERHHLHTVEVYTDRQAEAVDERQAALLEKVAATRDADGLAFVWSLTSASALFQQAAILYEQQRVVRITFGRLLDGVEIQGKMDELSWLARELTGAIDKLAAKIDTGRAFDNNQVRIYAPGDKRKPPKGKPGKPGKPPSEWGR